MSDDGGAGRFPLHPVGELEVRAYATLSTCEGSIGHLRQDFAWQLADDLRRIRAEDISVLDDFVKGTTMEDARLFVTHDATRKLTRWVGNPNAV